MNPSIRQPIVVVLGHVDSGKTSILDKIRGTAVQAREAGGITQHIGASFFPPETLKAICGPLLKAFGGDVKIPGLLVIDTPGHEAFSNLRQRGGSAADIAILVVDATKGLEPQTYESIEILRQRRVPFLVALNKIDLLAGWRPMPGRPLLQSIKSQDKFTQEELDKAIYTVVGQLSQLGFRSEAFYRVKNFTREVAIVPVSAVTGEGIAELLAVLVGLTQEYMQKRLQYAEGPARGIVLEVREEPGLGPTANVILVNGVLKVGDRIALGTKEGAIFTRVRALFMPKPLDEMRDPRDRFMPVEEVKAAAGVKVGAPNLEGVLAGSPLIGVEGEEDEKNAIEVIESEVKKVFIETDKLGIVLKADTLGSLEALIGMVRKKGIPIRIADIGPVTKRDAVQASIVREKDRYLGVILAFNVKVLEEAKSVPVPIFQDRVIYSLIDSYMEWVEREREAEARAIFSSFTMPAKFQVLKGFVFRRSNPAIFGIEVLAGRVKQKVKVMNADGKEVGTIHQIQSHGQPVQEAVKGEQVAISMREPTVGRQVKEGEILYTLPSSEEARLLSTKFRDRLSEEEQRVLDEIIRIRRKVHYLYGY